MSLSYRQEDQLRRAEAGVCWSDPHLAGMLGVLGRLYADDGMSPGSRWPRSPSAGATSGKPPPEAWPQRPAQQGCRRDHRQTGCPRTAAARSSSGEPSVPRGGRTRNRPVAAIGRSGGKHSRDSGTPSSGETEVNESFKIRKCPHAVADWLVLLQRD
jgi:hypothetical protein